MTSGTGFGTGIDIDDTPAAREALRALVLTRRVIVCVGSGGVGKTTTAATLGLAAAAAGRSTLVITIDPARRLANALGLEHLAHHPQAVEPALVQAAAAALPKLGDDDVKAPAPLFAMMLDLKAGWDDMLARTAPDASTATKILENRFYKTLSTELPGAHEFIACEHLQHLADSGRFELVVLDTPPTQNALDFLDAPGRILGVLDNDAFRFVADRAAGHAPSSFGARFLESATGTAQAVIAKFTGGEMLDELAEFLGLLKDLYEPLTSRTRAFVSLLSSPATAFVVVTAPQSAVLAEAAFFASELVRRQLPLSAAVVNRLTPKPTVALAQLDKLDDALAGVDDGVLLAAALDQAVNDEARAAQVEHEVLADLPARLGGAPTVRLPRLSDAVHDARRLVELVPWLVGRPAA